MSKTKPVEKTLVDLAKEAGTTSHTIERLREIARSSEQHPVAFFNEETEAIDMAYKGDTELTVMMLANVFGMADNAFLAQNVNMLNRAAQRPEDDLQALARKLTAGLASITSIEPEGAMQSMLATQLVATHNAAMDALAELSQTSYSDTKSAAANRASKLLNVHIRQLDAMNKMKGKGQQKVVVEHVHVHKGGQAIVGNVEGGGNAKK